MSKEDIANGDKAGDKTGDKAGDKAQGSDNGLQNKEINFFHHLEELRWIIIKIIIALISCAVIAYIFKDYIFAAIVKPLAGLDVTIIHLKVYEKFMAYIKLALYSGLILSFPFIIYYISKFVMPALYKNEKRWYIIGMSIVIVLFFSGAVLSYRVLAPISINFLLSFGTDNKTKGIDKNNSHKDNKKSLKSLNDKLSITKNSLEKLIDKESTKRKAKDNKNATDIEYMASQLINIVETQKAHNKLFIDINNNLILLNKSLKDPIAEYGIASYLSIGEYIDWIVVFIFMVGVVFQLPLLISILAKLGIVNEHMLSRFRPYALVIILIVGAIITPPDWVSQLIVALPVYLLYEISIIVTIIIRKRAKLER